MSSTIDGDQPMNTMTRTTLALALPGLLIFHLAVGAEDTPVVELTQDGSVDRMPLHTVVPTYPEKARIARLEGEVEVCFKVDHFGKTSGVAVRRSTNRIFEKPSRDAVRQSTYYPLPDGRTLSGIKTCRTFRYLLTAVEPEVPDS